MTQLTQGVAIRIAAAADDLEPNSARRVHAHRVGSAVRGCRFAPPHRRSGTLQDIA